jgi:transposase
LEAAFVHLCSTDHHRLNRSGDRRASHALWRIALIRMRCHPPTRAYVERRTNQGFSSSDIMRSRKR